MGEVGEVCGMRRLEMWERCGRWEVVKFSVIQSTVVRHGQVCCKSVRRGAARSSLVQFNPHGLIWRNSIHHGAAWSSFVQFNTPSCGTVKLGAIQSTVVWHGFCNPQ